VIAKLATTARNRKRLRHTVGKIEEGLERFDVGSRLKSDREKCFTSQAVTRRRKDRVEYVVDRARKTMSQLGFQPSLQPDLRSPLPKPYAMEANATRQRTHEDSINEFVGDEFVGKYANAEVVRWAEHDVRLRFFQSKAERQK
jgi:hypothetical protein